MPPAVEDKAIQDYVRSVTERIAKHSDLKIPLHVEVLQSREIITPSTKWVTCFSWRRIGHGVRERSSAPTGAYPA
jgi:hypothetical protein